MGLLFFLMVRRDDSTSRWWLLLLCSCHLSGPFGSWRAVNCISRLNIYSIYILKEKKGRKKNSECRKVEIILNNLKACAGNRNKGVEVVWWAAECQTRRSTYIYIYNIQYILCVCFTVKAYARTLEEPTLVRTCVARVQFPALGQEEDIVYILLCCCCSCTFAVCSSVCVVLNLMIFSGRNSASSWLSEKSGSTSASSLTICKVNVTLCFRIYISLFYIYILRIRIAIYCIRIYSIPIIYYNISYIMPLIIT